MEPLIKLKRLFHPVQPRFREGGDQVLYNEFQPDRLLAGHICCYWQLRTATRLVDPFHYVSVTDGCIDFVFDLNNPSDAFVMGFSSEHTSFQLQSTFNYVGIRFFPGAFPLLYNIDASELTNQWQNIGNVLPHDFNEIQALLSEQDSFVRIKERFDNYFKSVISSRDVEMDSRFAQSLHFILDAEGNVNVERLDTGISSRHLRRLFDLYVGTGPKEFNKIMRFQKLLRTNPTRAILRDEKFYYDLGYYDQSHFIKDFKSLYGLSPLKAFGKS